MIGQQKDTIHDYIRSVGVPDGFMAYTSIQEMEGLYAPSDKGAGVQYGQYIVKHYPRRPIQLGLYMVRALEGVTAGRYDDNIQRLGQWIKDARRPVYLRIGYEFDLPDNAYGPEQYKQAFRYIVEKLRRQKVGNVQYVWHSAAMIEKTADTMEWYPGDDVVDWFAVSFFSTMQVKPAGDFARLARAHHKTFMIAESAPAGMYTLRGKQDWFNRYFEFIKDAQPGIICYINSNWDSYPVFKPMHWGDSRVQKDDDVKVRWLRFLDRPF